MILVIDTSEKNCTIGLWQNDALLASVSDEIGRGHAEYLLPAIENMMAGAKADYADISRIGVGVGPGSFTGLRIGLSVARGLALALSIPCVGISGLMALAVAASHEGQVGNIIHALIMGRGGQAFYQAFKVCEGEALPSPLDVPCSLDAEQILTHIESRPGPVVGSGYSLLSEQIAALESMAPYRVRSGIRIIEAGALASLTLTLEASQNLPEPLYLRAADAAKKKALLPVE